MNTPVDSLFLSHPDPMWIYDLETLKFLEVNGAAVAKYGYSRAEFLRMSIADIRPEEDVAALRENVASVTQGRDEAGVWRHRLKSGDTIFVDITGHTIEHDGRAAELIAARDVTHLIDAERRAASALARERAARRASDALTGQLRLLFDAIPGRFLVLSPDEHVIIAASDAFIAATESSREQLIGQCVFDVFRDQGIYEAARLRDSLERVVKTGEAESLPVSAVSPSIADGHRTEARYWSATNTPLLNPAGEAIYVLHRTEDCTEAVLSGRLKPGAMAPQHETAMVGYETMLRAKQLRSQNAHLADLVAQFNSVKRLLNLGYWEYDLADDRLRASDEAFRIYGMSRDSFGGRLEDYIALVHPEDRSAMKENLSAFLDSGREVFDFSHRIRRWDGALVHVHGVAERINVPGRNVLVGAVQDTTSQVLAQEELAGSKRLLEIAGETARFGAWRYDARENRLAWTPETARIHDEPPGTAPSVEAGIAYYAPHDRERVSELFGACLGEGVPYRDVFQVDTAAGRRIWVRSTGEAEYDSSGRIVAVRGSFQDITDLMQERERVAALGDRLASTLEQIGDGFMAVDRQGIVLYLNARAEDLLDRDRQRLVGQRVIEAFPEARDPAFRAGFEEALRTGVTARLERYLPHLDRWLRINVHPTGEGLALYFDDIGDERRRDAQLQLLETAIGRVNDIVLITEARPIDGPEHPKIVYANDAFSRLTGYGLEEAVGATPRILQGPETDRAELDRIRAALERSRPVRAELINYTRDGSPYWIELDIVPITDKDGAHTHWVAVERDITERRSTEEALRINEERLRRVAQATGTAAWEWDLVEQTQWWSDGLLEIFGHDPDEMASTPTRWLDQVHPDDLARVTHGRERLRCGESDFVTEQYRFRREDGSWAIVLDSSFVIRDQGGQVTRVLGSLTDITQRVELEDRLRQSEKLQAVGELTGGVAHDFNNLLTIVLGNAETLAGELSSRPTLQALAEMISTAADKGADLTGRLLAFSRKQMLEPRTVDIGVLLHGMDDLLRRTLPENVEIRQARATDLWPADLDPAQLEAALLNLAINARDAMPDGGQLTLEASNVVLDADYAARDFEVDAGDHVLIAVTDTGVGMPPEVAERVFEPFFTTKPPDRGSGMGLSMVYGFVKQSHGHIRLYSEVGVGTSFKLYFPRSQAEPEALESPSQTGVSAGGGEKILVVEDNALVRDFVLRQLDSLGYRTLSASSGPEALDVLERDRAVDLLFTDIVMPGGMDGRELADAARARIPGIGILFTSGYTEESMVHNGRLDPGVDLLSKPYRREELASRMRKILDR